MLKQYFIKMPSFYLLHNLRGKERVGKKKNNINAMKTTLAIIARLTVFLSVCIASA